MKTAQKPDVIVHRLSVCEVWRDTLTESGSEADAFIRLTRTVTGWYTTTVVPELLYERSHFNHGIY